MNLTEIEKLQDFKISIKSSENSYIRIIILLPGLYALFQRRHGGLTRLVILEEAT